MTHIKQGQRAATIVSLFDHGKVTYVLHYAAYEQADMESAVLAYVKAGHEVRVLHLDVHEGGA